MAEKWDLYDENREKTGEFHERGLEMPEGRFHIVVDIWTVTKEGKVILDQRHPNKRNGLRWECTGGSVLAGEDSIQGALREIGEELGLHLTRDDLHLIHTIQLPERFVDTYVTIQDVGLQDLHLQETEVVDAKLVSYQQLMELYNAGDVSPHRLTMYQDILKEWMDKAKK